MFPAIHPMPSYFDPSYVHDLKIWLDGQDTSKIVQSGGLVSQWTDKSGNSNNAIQNTNDRKPAFVSSAINGRSALQGFPGSFTSQMDIADNATLNYSEFTSIVVGQRLVDTGSPETFVAKWRSGLLDDNREIVHGVGSNDAPGILASPNGGLLGQVTVRHPNDLTAAPFISLVDFDGATLRAEDPILGTAGTGAMGNVFNGNAKYTVFARQDFTEGFRGYIGEHLFYSRKLTSVEIDRLTLYLKAKWAL